MDFAEHELEWFRLPVAGRQAWVGFLRVHKQLMAELDRELHAACGLSMSAYDVLVQLSIAPGRRRRMFELADAVLLSRSALTRRVTRLEDAGYVVRRTGERDPRQTFAHITPKGMKLLATTTPAVLDLIRGRFLDPLPVQDVEHLVHVWSRILDGALPPVGPPDGA